MAGRPPGPGIRPPGPPQGGMPMPNPYQQGPQRVYQAPERGYSTDSNTPGSRAGSAVHLASDYDNRDCASPSSRSVVPHGLLTLTAFPASEDGGYSRSYAASEASHMSYTPDASPFADPISQEPYPAWSAQRQIPLSTEEVEDIFFDLQQKFGFQRDSMRNLVRFRHLPVWV
jgi:1,3-beta-glucan synthase